MAECTAESPAQQFQFNAKGRLRSREKAGYCAMPRFKNNSMHMIDCSMKNSKRSWHLTKDERSLRVLGSNLVLGVVNNVIGAKPIVTVMDEGKEELQFRLIVYGTRVNPN